MSTFTGYSAGRVPVHLADLEAVGIRVLRDGEVFGTFAASIPGADRVDPAATDRAPSAPPTPEAEAMTVCGGRCSLLGARRCRR